MNVVLMFTKIVFIYILYKNGSKIDSVFGSWINYVICLFPIMFVKCPLRV